MPPGKRQVSPSITTPAGSGSTYPPSYHPVMRAADLARHFADGLAYEPYVATGTAEQQRRWGAFDDAVRLTDAQRQLVAGFTRDMRVLVVSGVWCGDCVQ